MQRNIHPNYNESVEIICACGNSLVTGSVLMGPIRVEICSQCHPFFTGEKRLVDTEGRVDRFVRQREEAQKRQEVVAERKSKSPAGKEKKQQDRPLTLRELLQQNR